MAVVEGVSLCADVAADEGLCVPMEMVAEGSLAGVKEAVAGEEKVSILRGVDDVDDLDVDTKGVVREDLERGDIILGWPKMKVGLI